MRVQPSQEEFDAMNDARFCDWWDSFMEDAMANASDESEVEEAEAKMKAAFAARWA